MLAITVASSPKGRSHLVLTLVFSFAILQRVALLIGKFSRAVKLYIMEYQGVASENYYNYPEIHLANTYYDSNSYL